MGLTNILAMDGGNGIVTADLLQKLEDVNHNRYLNRADLFVGTSAGGINSLFLASQDNPTDALQHILEFWTNVNRSILGGLSAAESRSGRKRQSRPMPYCRWLRRLTRCHRRHLS